MVTATTRESPTLSDEERFSLYEAAVDEVGDRATVVAGTGTYATEHSVHLTARAHEIGVDGFLVITPYYNKPPVRGIVEHFKAIAAVSIGRSSPTTSQAASSSTSRRQPSRLAEIPTVRAVKQANDDLAQARGIVELGLDLYAGDDDLVLHFLEVRGEARGLRAHPRRPGGESRSSSGASAQATSRGPRELDRELAPSIELLRVVINPIAIKCALNLLGHEVGGVRLPLVGRPTRNATRCAAASSASACSSRSSYRHGSFARPARDARGRAGARSGLGRPRGPEIAGVTTGPGGRTWDAVAADCPDYPGEGVTFTVLDDGTIIVSTDLPDGSLAPLAEALEATVSPPYRAAAAGATGRCGPASRRPSTSSRLQTLMATRSS